MALKYHVDRGPPIFPSLRGESGGINMLGPRMVISVQKRSKDIFKTDKRDLRCSNIGFDPELEAGVVRVTGLKLCCYPKRMYHQWKIRLKICHHHIWAFTQVNL
jgi:hypothetical protein